LSRKRHGSPAQFAKKCVTNGLRWIALGGPWHDQHGNRWINKPSTIWAYAAALSKVGVAVHVWGYPWWDRVDEFVADMAKCTTEDVMGWLLDPELGLKNHPDEASKLVKLCRQRDSAIVLGFTSYGLSKGHPTFPWAAFAKKGMSDPTKECDYGSPQLYDTPKNKVIQGMSEYVSIGFDYLIPSFGLYKWVKRDPSLGPRLPNGKRNRMAVPLLAPELDAHLLSFVDSDVPVQGMIGWAENFCTPALWRVLKQWSERLDRGACAL